MKKNIVIIFFIVVIFIFFFLLYKLTEVKIPSITFSKEEVQSSSRLVKIRTSLGMGPRSLQVKKDIIFLIDKIKTLHPGSINHKEELKILLDNLELLKEEQNKGYHYFCNQMENIFNSFPDGHTILEGTYCNNTEGDLKDGGYYNFKKSMVSDKKLKILQINSLNIYENQLLEAMAEYVESNLENETDLLILDLRNCKGGNLKAANILSSIIYGLDYEVYENNVNFPTIWTKIIARRSKDYDLIRASLNLAKMNRERRQEAIQSIINNSKVYEEEYYSFKNESFEQLNEFPLAILTSSKTKSACEFMALNLQFYKNINTFGENTHGALNYINHGYIYLPNLDILMTFPTGYILFEEKNEYERIGIKPHVKMGLNEKLDIKDLTTLLNYF